MAVIRVRVGFTGASRRILALGFRFGHTNADPALTALIRRWKFLWFDKRDCREEKGRPFLHCEVNPSNCRIRFGSSVAEFRNRESCVPVVTKVAVYLS